MLQNKPDYKFKIYKVNPSDGKINIPRRHLFIAVTEQLDFQLPFTLNSNFILPTPVELLCNLMSPLYKPYDSIEINEWRKPMEYTMPNLGIYVPPPPIIYPTESKVLYLGEKSFITLVNTDANGIITLSAKVFIDPACTVQLDRALMAPDTYIYTHVTFSNDDWGVTTKYIEWVYDSVTDTYILNNQTPARNAIYTISGVDNINTLLYQNVPVILPPQQGYTPYLTSAYAVLVAELVN